MTATEHICPAEDDDDYGSEELESLELECGLGDDGQCSLAGTEHCDFECPWRDSEDFVGSAAWKRKNRLMDTAARTG